jgi:two-component system, chemotaxis family, response regulator Rcp1
LSPRSPAQILLVEDTGADVDLTREVFIDAGVAADIHAVHDGEQALRFLRREGEFGDRPRPDLVLLDLNLPRKDGREVLIEIKGDPDIRRTPVLVLTTSSNTQDVRAAYDHHANAYIQKPVGLEDLLALATSIRDFWLDAARLPEE